MAFQLFDRIFSLNFKITKEGTIDSRQMVDDFADLLNLTREEDYIKNGFPISVSGKTTASERGLYICMNNDALDQEESWLKLGDSPDLSDYLTEDEINQIKDDIYSQINDTFQEFREIPQTIIEKLTDENNWDENNNFVNEIINQFPSPDEGITVTKENPYPPDTPENQKTDARNYFIQSGVRYKGDPEYYYVFGSDNTPSRTPKSQSFFTTAEIQELSNHNNWNGIEFDNSGDKIKLIKGRKGFDNNYKYECMKTQTSEVPGVVVRTNRV